MKSATPHCKQRTTTVPLLIAYVTFGALHEFAHLVTAWALLPSSMGIVNDDNIGSNTVSLILRMVLGRCVAIPHNNTDDKMTIALIYHSGWICSAALAILTHALYKQSVMIKSPIVPLAAYVTAVEGIATDLLGFIPQHQKLVDAHYLTFFCGNFGVLLLNSSWLSIDGGRTALDVLEKMVSAPRIGCIIREALRSFLHSSSLTLFLNAHHHTGQRYHDEGSTIRRSGHI